MEKKIRQTTDGRVHYTTEPNGCKATADNRHEIMADAAGEAIASQSINTNPKTYHITQFAVIAMKCTA